MNPRFRPLAATAVIFLVAYAVCVFQFPAMWSTRVLGNFLTDNAFLGIAAVGTTFVILAGGIDLSVGAVIGFTGVLLAILISWFNIHPLMAFAIVLVVAAGFGAAMGAVIHFLEVPPFIVTLGRDVSRPWRGIRTHARFRFRSTIHSMMPYRPSISKCLVAAASA